MPMDSYIAEAIDKPPKEMMKTIKTLAGNHLFKVDDTCVKLCRKYKIIFHWFVAKLLFLSKHARPDIQPIITFLAARVRNPEEDNWNKLRRVLSYLDTTINIIKLHLNVNDLNVFHWWVDAS